MASREHTRIVSTGSRNQGFGVFGRIAARPTEDGARRLADALRWLEELERDEDPSSTDRAPEDGDRPTR